MAPIFDISLHPQSSIHPPTPSALTHPSIFHFIHIPPSIPQFTSSTLTLELLTTQNQLIRSDIAMAIHLPPEVLLMVFDNIEYAADLNSVALTCRSWNCVVTVPFLYPNLAKTVTLPGICRVIKSRNFDALRLLFENGIHFARLFADMPQDARKGFKEMAVMHRELSVPKGRDFDEDNGFYYAALAEGRIDILRLAYAEKDLIQLVDDEIP